MRRSPARTLLPFALLVVTLGALVRIASFPLGNNDTFFHLRFGHEFLSGAWSLRHPGSVTTFATADWVPTQWLPQIVMAQIEEWFGLPGVAWLCRAAVPDPGPRAVVGLPPPGRACGRRPDRRPGPRGLLVGDVDAAAAVSYILVVLTTAAWIRARTTGRAPWLLVPVTWVWAMCHGMWPVGSSSAGWPWSAWPSTGSTRPGSCSAWLRSPWRRSPPRWSRRSGRASSARCSA